jgi:hypothetical protein
VWVEVYQLVGEQLASCEVSECGRKFINWLVEMIANCEVCECMLKLQGMLWWGKFGHWFIKVMQGKIDKG